MRFWSKTLITAGLSLAIGAGCGSKSSAVAVRAAQSPTTRPITLTVMAATQPVRHIVQTNICFDCPADWLPQPATTAVFAITAPPCPQQSYASLSLDIPHLPWHVPGMITLSMVAQGYESDLKKNQIHDATLQDQTTLTIHGEKARRVTTVGHINSQPAIDIAIIIIHADKVYILSVDSDNAGRTAAQNAIELATASLTWK